MRPCGLIATPGFVCLLTLAGFGCDSGGRTTEIAPMQHPTLEDFPLPAGFSLVRDHSQSRTSGSMRMVQYEFEGRENWNHVIQFFRQQLPPAGWNLRQQRLERGPYFMRFESDREECDIRIRPTGMKTVVNVDIGPLPRGSAERQPVSHQTPRK